MKDRNLVSHQKRKLCFQLQILNEQSLSTFDFQAIIQSVQSFHRKNFASDVTQCTCSLPPRCIRSWNSRFALDSWKQNCWFWHFWWLLRMSASALIKGANLIIAIMLILNSKLLSSLSQRTIRCNLSTLNVLVCVSHDLNKVQLLMQKHDIIILFLFEYFDDLRLCPHCVFNVQTNISVDAPLICSRHTSCTLLNTW